LHWDGSFAFNVAHEQTIIDITVWETLGRIEELCFYPVTGGY
jgi:hypothetical protein